MSVAILLVTCCLEESRADILSQVIHNIRDQAPELGPKLTVFDNASTEPGIKEQLLSTFNNVYQTDRNVGYWSAIDWWLESLSASPPDYTYIIESDMIHYDFNKLWTCASFLDNHPEVGSVRLHEYSVNERHLYDKGRPRPESKRGLWQTHTNRLTGKAVDFKHVEGDIWSTTFLTQLPALNRYQTMRDAFIELRTKQHFTEVDFQEFYWKRFQQTGILDGGIFHCNLNQYGAGKVTGSWTSDVDLKRLGYRATRTASIIPRDQYIVTKL